MKTNKKMTLLPKKKRHFYTTERHFIPKHTYFAETVGSFVTLRALGKNPSLQNVSNSRKLRFHLRQDGVESAL